MNERNPKRNPCQEGKAAFNAGQPITANPYQSFETNPAEIKEWTRHNDWNSGWVVESKGGDDADTYSAEDL